MRNLYLFFALILCSLPTLGQGVKFEELTVEEAVAKAKAEDKYVFIDVFTSWCGPCKMMKEKVFPMEEVGNYFNKRFVTIELNAESGVDGPMFANKYNVHSYPTFIILDGNGELVHMFAGGVLDLSFIDRVAVTFDKEKAFGDLKKRYESGERDSKLVSNYIQALIKTNTVKVDSLVNDFYDSLKDKEKISEECLFVFEQFAPLGSDRELFFEKNEAKFRKVIGSEKYDEIIKKAYEYYFGMIVKRSNGSETEEGVKEMSDRLGALKVKDLGTIGVFEKAAIVKVTQSGKKELFETIKGTASTVSANDLDLALYIVIPGLKEQLTDDEKKELLAMVTNDNVKGYVIRSLR